MACHASGIAPLQRHRRWPAGLRYPQASLGTSSSQPGQAPQGLSIQAHRTHGREDQMDGCTAPGRHLRMGHSDGRLVFCQRMDQPFLYVFGACSQLLRKHHYLEVQTMDQSRNPRRPAIPPKSIISQDLHCDHCWWGPSFEDNSMAGTEMR